MVMSQTIARMSIAVGLVELSAATICVVFGAIAMGHSAGDPSSSAGLWTLFYGIPGGLSIMAGRSKNTGTMAVALFFNIVATIVSSLGALFSVMFWSNLNEFGCTEYDIDCSKIGTETAVVAMTTVIMVILAITSFAGCILGCMGTCCQPHETIIISTIPSQQPTVVINTQSGTQFPQPTYHPMVAQNFPGTAVQDYLGPPTPVFGAQQNHVTSVVDDDKALVENMVL